MTAYKHYTINKSWAFWLEVTVISIEVPLVIFCAIENAQLMKVDALIKLSDIASMQSIPRTSPYFRSPSSLGLQDHHFARPAHVIRTQTQDRTSTPRITHHLSRPQTSSSQDSSNCTACPIHCSHRTMNSQYRNTTRPFSPSAQQTSFNNTYFKSFSDDEPKCTSGNCYHSSGSSSRVQRESVEVTKRDRNSLSSSKHVKISQSHSQSPSITPDHSRNNTFLNSVFEDLPILSQHPLRTPTQNQRPVDRY